MASEWLSWVSFKLYWMSQLFAKCLFKNKIVSRLVLIRKLHPVIFSEYDLTIDNWLKSWHTLLNNWMKMTIFILQKKTLKQNRKILRWIQKQNYPYNICIVPLLMAVSEKLPIFFCTHQTSNIGLLRTTPTQPAQSAGGNYYTAVCVKPNYWKIDQE